MKLAKRLSCQEMPFQGGLILASSRGNAVGPPRWTVPWERLAAVRIPCAIYWTTMNHVSILIGWEQCSFWEMQEQKIGNTVQTFKFAQKSNECFG